MDNLANKMFLEEQDYPIRILRKNSVGVGFNFIISDSVAAQWYANETDPIIDWAAALKTPLQISKPNGSWLEMAEWRSLIKSGDSVVDCGCHHGMTTIFASAECGTDGSVIAIDAVLRNVEITRANLRINNIQNAVAVCIAVGGKRGLISLIGKSNSIAIELSKSPHDTTIMVMLDDILPSRVDVLKLDIEGAELDAIEQSERLKSIPRLLIEVHTDMLPENGPQRLAKALGNRKILVIDEDAKSIAEYTGEPITKRVHFLCKG